MAGFYSIGHFKGAPIRLHWTFALALFVVLLSSHEYFWFNRVAGALCLILPYLLLTLVHELGHAYVAHRRGLQVIALEIYPVHGRCIYQMPHYEMDHVMVAWAGVTAQAILLLPALAASLLLKTLPFELQPYAGSVLSILITINLVSIVFNLLPFDGLDGKTAWRIVPIHYANLKQHWRGMRDRATTKAGEDGISKAKAQEIADEAIKKIMTKDQTK